MVASLFDPTKFEKRKLTSYDEAIGDLKVSFGDFNEIFHEAFKKMEMDLSSKPPHYQNKHSKSNRMNENLQGLLIDKYGLLKIKFEAHKVFYLDWQGKYKIYIKKLDNHYKPQYNQTNSSQKRLYQRELFPNDYKHILYMGYQCDDLWTCIKGVYIVSIDNNKLSWREKIDLELINNSIEQIENDELEVLVKPKIKKIKSI